MKRRSRTGCQKCRSRRIKCDESRPVCENCAKKGQHCNYDVSFRWIQQHVAPTNGKRKGGPVSRRKQQNSQTNRTEKFDKMLSNARQFEMIEISFIPQDEPITELNGPGSLTQFKKFVIRNTNKSKNTFMLPSFKDPQTDPKGTPNPAGVPSFKKNPNVALPVFVLSSPREPPEQIPPLLEMTETDFVDHFTAYTADTLVPVPYEESPFVLLLPTLSKSNEGLRAVLSAYGALHLLSIKHRLRTKVEDDDRVVQVLIESASNLIRTQLQTMPDSSSTLLGLTLLAHIEADRRNAQQWRFYLQTATTIINDKGNISEWDLTSEANSTILRLTAAMCALGNLGYSHSNLVPFPLWPEWAGSLDFLTGFDLNFVQYFDEGAKLFLERDLVVAERPPDLIKRLGVIHRKALRVTLLMNDFWVESYLPDSDVSALCILYQEMLKLHFYRRMFKLPRTHPNVQGLVTTMIMRIERWIPQLSTTHRHMSLILVTLAVECLDPILNLNITTRLVYFVQLAFCTDPSFLETVQQVRDEGGLDSQKFFSLLLV